MRPNRVLCIVSSRVGCSCPHHLPISPGVHRHQSPPSSPPHTTVLYARPRVGREGGDLHPPQIRSQFERMVIIIKENEALLMLQATFFINTDLVRVYIQKIRSASGPIMHLGEKKEVRVRIPKCVSALEVMNSDADTDKSQDPDFSLNGGGCNLFVILETLFCSPDIWESSWLPSGNVRGTLRRQRPEGGGHTHTTPQQSGGSSGNSSGVMESQPISMSCDIKPPRRRKKDAPGFLLIYGTTLKIQI